MEKLFKYARGNVLSGHKFSDDVAICYAENKDEAVAIFKKLYIDPEKYVSEATFNDYGVCILTDY